MLRLLVCLTIFSFIKLPAGAQFFESGKFSKNLKFHFKSIVIDTHNDVLSTVTMKGLRMENDLSGKAHSDISRFKQGGVDVQVFAVFSDERFGKDTAFKYANIEIDSLYAIALRNPKQVMMVRNLAELKQAVKQKKLGCMMGLEGGHMIEDRIDYLDSLYKRGIRYMTLTWNNSTSWASSAKDETAGTVPNQKKGLNELGKQIVKRMNELGMMVDLSHVGEQTFWDAISTSAKPVIVSHSCAWSLCPVPRNLKDAQIKAVAGNGGVIHVNFYSGFIDSNYNRRKDAVLDRHKGEVDSMRKLKRPNYEIEEMIAQNYPDEMNAIRPELSQLMDHIDYLVKLAGIDHVGLGSDFDGIESAPRRLDSVKDFPQISLELRRRGYNKKEVRKILGGNFLRVYAANEKK